MEQNQHGLSGSKIYSVWVNMKASCRKCELVLFEKWKEFIPFYEWALQNNYKEGLYLNRRDKNIGYLPDNLEFVTKEISKGKHQKYNTRLYKIWIGMKHRCFQEDNKAYHHYGGRGITVCEEWSDFQSFYDWSMKNGYSDELSIDRVDVNGDYEPGNCEWVTTTDQANNKRTNINITLNGEKKTMTEWAHFFEVNPVTVSQRYRRGIRGIELFEEAEHKSSPIYIEINNEIRTLRDWEKITGVSRGTIRERLNKGLIGEELISKEKSNVIYIELHGERKNLKEWAKSTGIGYDIICERYKKGIRDERLLKKENDKEIYVEIDGVKKTLTQWANETEDVTYSAISQRYANGVRGKDLLKAITKKKIEITHNGETCSINAWGKKLGINPETIRRRYINGLRGEDLFKLKKDKTNKKE
ncbi:hypothetical protein ACS2B2_25685 [Bacillus cereus group sp. BceL297]|uniref:hypothetical protein n=1 Tax=unclassified Bacillus cereus group TaxID=2750818 RepID=UPI003F2395FC